MQAGAQRANLGTRIAAFLLKQAISDLVMAAL